jgi:hypothetical protein
MGVGEAVKDRHVIAQTGGFEGLNDRGRYVVSTGSRGRQEAEAQCASGPVRQKKARRRGGPLSGSLEISQHDFEPHGSADAGQECATSEPIAPHACTPFAREDRDGTMLQLRFI